MATATYTSGTLHTTDAEFRIWGKELSDTLQTFSSTPGLVKTGDTGQINWATVTRASPPGDAGYEIYYLNDSLHGTAPIYIRIDYGTAAGASRPRIKVTIGTGTNGAGTLTGITGTATICTSDTVNGAATTVPTYICVNTGFFGLAWKCTTTNTPQGGFIICRSCDADGTPNAKAAIICYSIVATGTNTYTQTLRFESVAAAQTQDVTGGGLSLVPGNVTSSSIGGANLQVYMCWMNAPDVRPVFGIATVVIASHALATTFSVALVGSTARTYIALNANSFGSPANKNVAYTLAMLYE